VKRADRQAFRAWLLEQRYAPATITVYVGYAGRCGELLAAQGRPPLRRAGPDDVRAFLAALPATASSWNQARKALIAYYRSIGRRGHPVEGIDHVPEPRRLPRPLSTDGHARFLGAARVLGGRHQLVGLMFATTACRFSSLQRARWIELELDGDAPYWHMTTKGADRRGPNQLHVPLHSAVVPLLGAWRRSCGSPLWVLPGGARAGHMGERALRTTFREICDLAGLENVVPHQLRHTVATTVLEQCGDLRAVQELLGHANLATTQIYTKVRPSRLRAVVEALPA
jgi:integrase